MSGESAIAAVTLTLKSIIADATSGADLTTRAPDRARAGKTLKQVNLFLYAVSTDGSWGNRDYPGGNPGETGRPPLPLVLHYLLSVYPPDDAEDEVATLEAQRLLGAAMRAFHDHPVLDREKIASVAHGSNLHLQADRVRLTAHALSNEELSKLWGTFQTPYRTSVAYEARVVLVESTRESRTPVPVLTRNLGAIPEPLSPFPHLTTATGPKGGPLAVPGDSIDIHGTRLDAPVVKVHMTHPRLTEPLLIDNPAITPAKITFVIPLGSPAGVWSISLTMEGPGDTVRSTTSVPLAIAPTITAMPSSVQLTPDGGVDIEISCSPPIWEGQTAALLLGHRMIAHPPLEAQTSTVTFTVAAAEPGDHYVRLRVDGVDSQLIDDNADPPAYRADRRITVTP